MALDTVLWPGHGERMYSSILKKLADLDKDVPVTFEQDPLALSWASYHKFVDHGPRWMDLNLVTPDQQDHALAQLTRAYYLGRYAMQALAKGKITEYQRKVYNFLNGGEIKTKDVGMIYKLPYFFNEDRALDQLVTDPRVKALPAAVDIKNRYHPLRHQLTALETVLESRQGGENTLYLWTTEDQHLVMWRVSQTNPLATMVQDLWERGSVTMCGAFIRKTSQRTTGTLQFLELVRPTLA